MGNVEASSWEEAFENRIGNCPDVGRLDFIRVYN